MNKYLKIISISIFLIFYGLSLQAQTGNVGIGTNTPDPSAILHLDYVLPSNSPRGFLAPRMTQTERNSISSPATGLIVYQTDNTPGFYYYAGPTSVPNWVRLLESATGQFLPLSGGVMTGPISGLTGLSSSGTIIFSGLTPNKFVKTKSGGELLTDTIVTSDLPLASGSIYIGNASNKASEHAISGEATISSLGAVTLNNDAVISKVLNGFAIGSNSPITSSDSILSAFKKTQGQINNINSTISALHPRVSIRTTNQNGLLIDSATQVLSIDTASASSTGALSNASWAYFNKKEDSIKVNGPLTRSTNTISINQSTGSADGYLSSLDWTKFDKKEDSLKFNSPLSRSTNIVTLPKSDSLTNGYLSKEDWLSFTGKEGSLPKGNLTELTSDVLTITGGANAVIGSGASITVKQSNGTTNGFLSSGDWTNFNKKEDSIRVSGPLTRSTNTISINQSTGSADGYLSSIDWTKFDKKEDSLKFNSPLSRSTNTVTLAKSDSLTNGYLSKDDWSLFNGKEGSLPKGNLTELTSDVLTIAGGSNAVIGAGASITVKQSNGTTNGFLSSSDWTNFNKKEDSIKVNGPLTRSTNTISINQSTGSADGYLSSLDWTKFDKKEDSLKFNSPLSRSTNTVTLPKSDSLTNGYLSKEDWLSFTGKEGSLPKGNLTELTSDVLTISGGANAVIGSGASITVKQSNGSTNGFLGSSDWTNFNKKEDSIKVNGPLTRSTNTISINQSTGSADGYLSSLDWTKFDKKEDSLKFNSPLSRSTNTVTLPKSDSLTNGYLSKEDWLSFTGKEGSLPKGNLTELTSDVLTIAGGTSAVIGAGASITVKQSNGSTNGFLSSSDWTNFNKKEDSIRVSGPLTRSTNTISVNQSTGSADGYLSSLDWTKFDKKEDSLKFNSPLSRSTNTVTLPKSDSLTNGYLSKEDWLSFFGKEGSLPKGNLTELTSDVLTITGGANAVIGSGASITVKQSNGSTNGFLSSGDWTYFNKKEDSIKVNGPLTRSTNTISVNKADGSTDGFLSKDDWNTFNNKLSSLTRGNFTTGTGAIQISGSGKVLDGDIVVDITTANASDMGLLSSSDWTNFNKKEDSLKVSGPLTRATNIISVNKADGSTDGYLSKDDWNTFSNKLSSLTRGNFTTGTGAIQISGSGKVLDGDIVVDITTANASDMGLLSSSDWTNFNKKEDSLKVSGPLTRATNIISVNKADGSTDGYLSKDDWNTFNNKLSSLTRGNFTSGTGAIQISGSGKVLDGDIVIDIPTASSSESGLLIKDDWKTFNSKQDSLGSGTTDQFLRGDKTWQTISVAPSGTANQTLRFNGTTLDTTSLVSVLSDGKTGFNVDSAKTQVDINGGISMRPADFTATNNATLDPGNRSYIKITSSTLDTLCKISIGDGLQAGQILILQCTTGNSNGCQLDDIIGDNLKLTGRFTLNNFNTISFIWDGAFWVETSRSQNHI